MKYLEQVKEAVIEYLDENSNVLAEHADGIVDWLDDELWSDDSVTGNASGSYTFSRALAKEYVFDDFDTVIEALEAFCTPNDEIGKRFLEEDWEWFDVIARCYILRQAIEIVLDERA